MSNATLSAGNAGTRGSTAAVTLAGRVLLSAIFIVAGFGKLTAVTATAGWFGAIGLPFPAATAVVVGLLELFGGLAILVGYQTRIAAVALSVFTLAATGLAHLDFADMNQVLFFQKNLAITGGLLILAAFGPGALAVDARR